MSEIREDGMSFVGYEYLEVPVKSANAALCLDGYQSFGWVPDDHSPADPQGGKGKMVLKRDRKILNKVELTRLQRHFEACLAELAELERSKSTRATICAISVGLIGTVFMALSTFAVTHEPPLVVLSALFAIPGFLGWILPWFLYRGMVRRRTVVVNELMERKYDEIYEICKKGSALLNE
ncbi:MAG: hypothetical protein KH420_03335 [Clostridiales bacterium]|nr:hypothetical protein [Clostridiales bacterium]